MSEETAGRFAPTRCDMPDLSGLSHKVTLTAAFRRMFGAGPSHPMSWALVMNYIRIVDAVLYDYNHIRANIEKFVTSPPEVVSPFYLAINHAESCVTNLLRAIRLARRIRRHRQSPQIDKLPVLSDAIADRVRAIRDAIEHVDGQLIAGETPPSPHSLVTGNDRLQLYGKEITYAELAEWINALHTLSSELAEYQEQKNDA